ncbi:MAG: hypothetical protein J7M05_09775, partial [Anaerolineae bacterium]|nr:hypothetical protein [Anaerolineae bacterium]
MERFDVNCTLGRWPEGGPTWATTGQLLAEMDRLGIGKALVRHTLGRFYDPAYGNQVLTEEIGGEERLFPCWTALPPNTGELGPLGPWLSNLLAADVRAICLYPKSHGYPLAEWQCAALLAPLAEQHMLLLLELSEVSWEELHWLCKSYPKLQVILLNTGYRVLR